MIKLPLWGNLLAAAVLLSGVLWLKHTYDAKVIKEAVNDALVSERAITNPIIDGLKLELATIKAESEAEAIKRKAELTLKTKEYNNAIAKTKILKTELDSRRGSDDNFERLLNTIARNSSASGAGISTRYDRLQAAHQQCERDTREALDTAAVTIERLSEAVAVIDALKLK